MKVKTKKLFKEYLINVCNTDVKEILKLKKQMMNYHEIVWKNEYGVIKTAWLNYEQFSKFLIKKLLEKK